MKGGKGGKAGAARGLVQNFVPAPVIVEDVWAQCDKCNKWRRLPPGTVVDETMPW